MKLAVFSVALLVGLFPKLSFAKKTGFTEAQRGISFGGGTYAHLLPKENQWDPVPALLSSGTGSTGSDSLRLLPLKFGYFVSRGPTSFEPYLRYMIAQGDPWTSTGASAGSGTTGFKSYGAGINAAISLVQSERLQFNFVLNGEYIRQRATMSFTSSGSAAQTLKLQSTSLLAGAGFQPEIWLGDLWVLSLFGGYQYGFLRHWELSEAASFMGRSHPAGELRGVDGNRSKAQFGGFLVEASLKLNFYQ